MPPDFRQRARGNTPHRRSRQTIRPNGCPTVVVKEVYDAWLFVRCRRGSGRGNVLAC